MGQLLMLSRLEAGLSSSERDEVDFGQIVEEVTADGNFEAQALGKSVSLRATASVFLQNADPHALRSACENIIVMPSALLHRRPMSRSSWKWMRALWNRLRFFQCVTSVPEFPKSFSRRSFSHLFKCRAIEARKGAMAWALPSLCRRSGCTVGIFRLPILRPGALKYVFGCLRPITSLMQVSRRNISQPGLDGCPILLLI